MADDRWEDVVHSIQARYPRCGDGNRAIQWLTQVAYEQQWGLLVEAPFNHQSRPFVLKCGALMTDEGVVVYSPDPTLVRKRQTRPSTEP